MKFWARHGSVEVQVRIKWLQQTESSMILRVFHRFLRYPKFNHHFNSFFFSWFQVLDDKNVRRRFRASNYQSTTRVKPFICTMPMRLDDGWNQIQFNLSDFTRRAYGTNYIETLRVQVSVSQILKRHQLDTL